MSSAPRHIKVSAGGRSFEHCEDVGCTVDVLGRAACGREACPACGCSGTMTRDHGASTCSCGFTWGAVAQLEARDLSAAWSSA
jgi:hypothetical protein